MRPALSLSVLGQAGRTGRGRPRWGGVSSRRGGQPDRQLGLARGRTLGGRHALRCAARRQPFAVPRPALCPRAGVLPACDGQLRALLRPEFWQQSFVWCTILSELTLGAHDLMLNACSYHGTAPGRIVDAGGVDVLVASSASAWSDSFQFFFYSRISFCLTFALLFATNKRLTAQLHALLLGTVPARLIALSLVSEGLTILGYYLASIAYSLFYQAAVVHTAEASMSQLLNLMIAYALHHVFSIGRASAASGLRTKLVSFALVTIGLYLCGDEGGIDRRRR